jgi:hypothetical protein
MHVRCVEGCCNQLPLLSIDDLEMTVAIAQQVVSNSVDREQFDLAVSCRRTWTRRCCCMDIVMVRCNKLNNWNSQPQ